MLFIADIPPVTEVQNVEYNYIVEKNDMINQLEIDTLHTIVYLKQANMFVELSKRTEFTKAKENYKRLALLNFQAYLERLGE